MVVNSNLSLCKGASVPPANWPLWYSKSSHLLNDHWLFCYTKGVFFLRPKGIIIFFIKKNIANSITKVVFEAIEKMGFKKVA